MSVHHTATAIHYRIIAMNPPHDIAAIATAAAVAAPSSSSSSSPSSSPSSPSSPSQPTNANKNILLPHAIAAAPAIAAEEEGRDFDISSSEDAEIIDIELSSDDEEEGDEEEESDIEVIEQNIIVDASLPKKRTRKKKPKVLINDFFRPLKRKNPKPRGRPPKCKNRPVPSPPTPPMELRKRPPEELEGAVVAAAEDALPPPPLFPVQEKKTRINWGKPGPNRDKMSRAIDHWLNDGEDRFDFNGERIEDFVTYANYYGIPSKSFYRYIHPDETKRQSLGDGSRGKDKLLSDEEVRFAGQVIARQDRTNDGLSRKEAKDIIMDLSGKDISRRAASRQLSRRVLPINAAEGILKATLQKPQATTSDRTNINIAQQYRWHRIVDTEYDNLRLVNTGLCKKSGKTFGEVMGHFIIGLDEMCLMSDHNGNAHIIGSADKKSMRKYCRTRAIQLPSYALARSQVLLVQPYFF